MPGKIEQGAVDGTLEQKLEQELERERREHVLIDEEKLGMDELEEERLKEKIMPEPHKTRQTRR